MRRRRDASFARVCGQDVRAPSHRPLIHRRFIRQSLHRHIAHDFTVMRYAHAAVVANLADDYCIEIPLGKDVDHFALASLVRDDKHALLRF